MPKPELASLSHLKGQLTLPVSHKLVAVASPLGAQLALSIPSYHF